MKSGNRNKAIWGDCGKHKQLGGKEERQHGEGGGGSEVGAGPYAGEDAAFAVALPEGAHQRAALAVLVRAHRHRGHVVLEEEIVKVHNAAQHDRLLLRRQHLECLGEVEVVEVNVRAHRQADFPAAGRVSMGRTSTESAERRGRAVGMGGWKGWGMGGGGWWGRGGMGDGGWGMWGG